MSYATEQNLAQRVRMLDVVVTDEKLTHAAAAGSDTLKRANVQAISAVNSATGAGPDNPTYAQDVDYQLTGDTVDWSLGGSEPNAAAAYYVTYTYRALTTDEVRQNLADADALIDGIVAGAGYTLPFESTPPLLRTIATALAAYGCGRDVYGTPGAEIPARLEQDYTRASDWLDRIAAGKMRLVYAGGTAPSTARLILSSSSDYTPTFALDPIEDSTVDPDLLDALSEARSN
mgnify:FL=1